MQLQFTKMQGAGNDFIVIDAIHQDISHLSLEHWRALANRKFGIGADQILIVEKATSPDADFKYRIFNNDGSEVEQCGNGSRCFVRFVREKGLTNKTEIRVQVAHTILTLTELEDGRVKVNMGNPILEHALIPFLSGELVSQKQGEVNEFSLPLAQESVWITPVSMGNPHAVQIVESVDLAPVGRQGPLIENHPSFPQRVNAGFMEILSRHLIKLRVFERGAGETLACGTGACAAVVSGILQHRLDSPVLVKTKGGDLEIEWDFQHEGPLANVMMTGPAVSVFDGHINI
jgi:diaminopimelate epimerase